jgi:4-diphosphocytidyl-2-C-methyl-D-erythritol kinase
MPPAGYSIARARQEDLALLPPVELAAAQLLRGHAPDAALSQATDASTLTDAVHHGRAWVARAGGVPVGFAFIDMLADDLPHLAEVSVLPSHGRRGLGTALVRAACAWTGDAGFPMLTLTTFRAVSWNMPFYERLRFVALPPEQLRPALAAVVSGEAARGLAPETRVVMAYHCAQPMTPLE